MHRLVPRSHTLTMQSCPEERHRVPSLDRHICFIISVCSRTRVASPALVGILKSITRIFSSVKATATMLPPWLHAIVAGTT